MTYKKNSNKTRSEKENITGSTQTPFKMKITIIVPAFPPKVLGGTEIATYNIAKYLGKRGHEVHIITQINVEQLKGVEEEKFYVHSIKFKKIPLLGIMIFWIKVLFTLKKIKPDIIHAQNLDMGVGGVLAKLFLKIPYVVYGRGTDVYSPWIFKKTISKIIIKNAGAAITLTEDMKKEMTKIYSRDISVIPNGLDINKFNNLSKENIRRSMNISNDEKIIIFVGRLHPIKGVEYLIESMDFIRQNDVKTKLIIVGDGVGRKKLEKLVNKFDLSKNVLFVGIISNEDIPKYLTLSDILVLPSLKEGFPNILLEAMASGLPIVATNVGGIPEIIKNGENGFLVEPKNPKAISEKVLSLFENNEIRRMIIEKNREDAKKYNWENITEKLEEKYRVLKNTNKSKRNIFG
jgi:N-acetyl-alpha-D-glucosaminyl L-malate synthase BshA